MYRQEFDLLTVQLLAQSEYGSITEMKVWTDSQTEADINWQAYDDLIQIPVTEQVFARFRDEFGNQSEVFSDSVHPQGDIPDLPYTDLVFIPVTIR